MRLTAHEVLCRTASPQDCLEWFALPSGHEVLGSPEKPIIRLRK